MTTTTRGFAILTPAKRKEVSRKGGKQAWAMGKAHRWTREEAQAANRKAVRGRNKLSPPTAEPPVIKETL